MPRSASPSRPSTAGRRELIVQAEAAPSHTKPQPGFPGTGLASLIRRRPVTSYLVMAYAGLWAALVPVFFGAPVRVFTAVGAVIGLALPAFLVTAATEGRDGARDLLRRSLRWRLGIRWHLFALLAIPLGSALAALAFFGPTAREALVQDGASLALWFLLNFALALVTVQLFEELGWTGFVQHTLQARHGALKASVMVGVAFAMIHLPTYFVGVPLTGETMGMVLGQMVLFVPFAIALRTLMTWLYNRTGSSVLLVAILHAAFNTPVILAGLLPGPEAQLVLLAVVLFLALLVVVRTRGRLAYQPNRPVTTGSFDA